MGCGRSPRRAVGVVTTAGAQLRRWQRRVSEIERLATSPSSRCVVTRREGAEAGTARDGDGWGGREGVEMRDEQAGKEVKGVSWAFCLTADRCDAGLCCESMAHGKQVGLVLQQPQTQTHVRSLILRTCSPSPRPNPPSQTHWVHRGSTETSQSTPQFMLVRSRGDNPIL